MENPGVMRPPRLCRFVLFILFSSACMDTAKGVAEISPSRVALVCQVGDQLELTCSTSDVLQSWQFTVISESGTTMPYMRSVQSTGPAGVDTQPLTINSTIMVTFSRLSNQSSLPLMSRMLIDHVNEGLNGTEVECMNTVTSEVATTTIHIIGDILTAELNIQSRPEQFLSNRVMIILEWTLLNSLSRYRQLLQNTSVNVVPDLGVAIMFIGNMSIQLTLPYNTLYNVSVTRPGICGQPNQTAFIELSYRKCSNPLELTHINVMVLGYEEPSLEGNSVTFACPAGLIPTGSYSSTCMRNGEWEPNPREVTCTSGQETTTTITLSTCNNPLYVLQINHSLATMKESPKPEFGMMPICCPGFLITGIDTITCLENGEWELETTQKSEGMSDPANAMLKTALISITCVLVVISALMFIIGLLCGYYLSQRYIKSQKESESTPTTVTEHVEDLELKENVAYITIGPK